MDIDRVEPSPLTWTAPEPEKITVSWLDRAGLWVHYKVESTKFTIAVMYIGVQIALFIQQTKELSMQDEKWYQSRRVWSMLFAVIALVLQLFGKSFSSEEQEALINVIIPIVEAGAIVVSGALALWSRIFPKKPTTTPTK